MTTRTWEKILSQMKGEVSDQVYETWLRPLRYVTREGAVVFLATPHKFFGPAPVAPHAAQAAHLLVVVAVDFEPTGLVAEGQGTPTRRLVVKARKQDLDAHRAGRLSGAQLRAKVETTEY